MFLCNLKCVMSQYEACMIDLADTYCRYNYPPLKSYQHLKSVSNTVLSRTSIHADDAARITGPQDRCGAGSESAGLLGLDACPLPSPVDLSYFLPL